MTTETTTTFLVRGGACDTHIDEISPEDADALEQALYQVIDTIGEPEQCGIAERTMKEALWETYFDVPAAVDLLLQQKEHEDAQARKQAGTYTWAAGVGRCSVAGPYAVGHG